MSKLITPLLVKINTISFFLVLSFIYSGLTFATQNPDENQPIIIQSDAVEFDDKKGTALYRGNVIMEQGSRQLKSEQLFIQRDTKGNIEMMTANGSPALFHAKPNPEKPLALGHANTVQYFPKQDKIFLIENATLTQNSDSISGDHLIYFIQTGLLSSEPIPGKRTEIILSPHSSKTVSSSKIP